MIAIRIQKRIESETLHLPELRPLIGRDVEIVVHEAEPPAPGVGSDAWTAAAAAARELRETGYDFDAWREQREYDILATVALEHGVELWTRDKQFTLIQSALPAVRLFPEPP